MHFLTQERVTLEELLPGLDASLAGFQLMEMERPGNPSIPRFRELGGPGLLIPERLGGRGASPLQAVRAHRAIATRAPSLAVATTMHHFTIATVLEAAPESRCWKRKSWSRLRGATCMWGRASPKGDRERAFSRRPFAWNRGLKDTSC